MKQQEFELPLKLQATSIEDMRKTPSYWHPEKQQRFEVDDKIWKEMDAWTDKGDLVKLISIKFTGLKNTFESEADFELSSSTNSEGS